MEKVIIIFRSNPENYLKEKSGKKPNTVRFTDDWKKYSVWSVYDRATHIKIIHTENPNRIFTRKLTDKTTYKDLAIFSWKHKR